MSTPLTTSSSPSTGSADDGKSSPLDESLSTTTKPVIDLSVLVIGDSGTGKTNAIRTLSKPFVYDFDKGMATLHGSGTPYATFRDAPYGAPAMPARGIYKYGTAWSAFIDHLNGVGKQIDAGTCPYNALAFDSLTLLGDIALNFVMNVAGNGGQAPGIQHWGAQMNKLSMIIAQITSWPGIKYMTAHVQRDTNALTNAIEMLPLITGKLSGKVPMYFDEVYYSDVQRTGNKAHKYSFITRSDSVRKQARSRYNLPDEIPQDFSMVIAHIEKIQQAA